MAGPKKNVGHDLEDAVQLLERTRLRRPRMYRVVLHNDDYTTAEFVVEVLVRVFHKEHAEASDLMVRAHTKGTAVVGLYTRDVAETKVAAACEYAAGHGHPLLLTTEPDEPAESTERGDEGA